MTSDSSLFLLSFCFRNLLLEIFSDCAGNLRGFFIRHDEVPDRRRAGGEAHGAGVPPATGQGGPAGGARPCPWDLASTPSDAYKLLLALKTSRRPLFSRNSTRRAVTENPSSGSNLKLIPALCRRGDRSRRALHHQAFLRDDL